MALYVCPSLIGTSYSNSNCLAFPRLPGFAQSNTHQNSLILFWSGVPVRPYLHEDRPNLVDTCIARENTRHFTTPAEVSPRNNVWEMSAEIPHWWRVTTQIWVVLLTGWSRFPWGTTNQKHYPDPGSDPSSVWNFCAHFSDVISQGNRWWRREMAAVFSG